MRIRPGIRSLYAAIAILAAATVGGAHVLKSEAASSTIHGRAYVLDADTVRINGTTIRRRVSSRRDEYRARRGSQDYDDTPSSRQSADLYFNG